MASLLNVCLCFLYHLTSAYSACSPTSLAGGTYGLKLTGNGTSNGDVNSGDTWRVVTIKCLSTGHTFMNGVRRIPGVNVTEIDTSERIVTQCKEDGKWSPNVWYDHSTTAVASTTLMHIYCTPGCTMLPVTTHTVAYPAGVLTNEQYSAPVVPNSELYVKLACPHGYTTAVGDTGYSTLQCKQKVTTGTSGIDVIWSVDENNRLTCVRGCKDISTGVQYGETTASPSKVADGPPFSAGDFVPFSCKHGFQLIGHAKLTCTGDNVWSEELPQCVPKAGGVCVLYSAMLILSTLTLLMT